MAGRPPMGSVTTGPLTGTLKLSGIMIDPDPRGFYKPSSIELIVDGEPKTASLQLLETPSKLTSVNWEVKPAIFITAKSTISIQPYEACTLIQKKNAETVTIQGDAVLRFCSSRSGEKQEFKHLCREFRVILSVVVQKDTKLKDVSRSGLEDHAVLQSEIGQEVLFDPLTAPNSFKRALNVLHDLMKLPATSPDSGLSEIAREARDALKAACDSMPTDAVLGEDVQNLGKQVQDTLVDIQTKLPKFSGRLTSPTQTVACLLNLVGNAALFAEDCSKLVFKELGTVDYRTKILGDFDRQFTVLKRNFNAGKDTHKWAQPYFRPQVPTPPAPLPTVEEEARREVSTVGPELDRGTAVLDEDQRLMDSLKPDLIPTDLQNLCCLDSTRRELLSNITAWFDDTGQSNVLWLSGAPGTGKTALAWSLLAELEQQQRSAGGFFFRQNQHAPYQLWCTMAYKMANFHPSIKNEVYKAVTRNDDVHLDDVQWTFDNLIAAPLKALDARLLSRGPIVLIDGLEQCQQWHFPSWQTAVDTLSQWLFLPRHCKLIIISRPHGEIEKAFEGKDIKCLELSTDGVDSNTKNDVRTYLNHRFSEMRQDKLIRGNWPDGDAISKLVDHTGGFFKWAAIAVDYIQASSSDKENRLKTIIEDGTAITLEDFDQYLARIMFIFSHSEAFRATVGTIAFSMRPLTMGDLEHFLQNRFPSSSGGSLEATCDELLPIISIEGENKVIKVRHKAYKDYLTDPKRCDSGFLIDRSKVHRKMTVSCLKTMQQELKFNICGLKSSYLMNSEVEDKDALIEKCIPSFLAYACQHWADHLRGIASTEKRDTEIVNLLRNFLNIHLLHWLEALSLLSKSNIACRLLCVAAEWLEVTDKDLSLMAADASLFSLTFADIISRSFPHIYLSALPFAPPTSLISRHYREQFPRTIKVLHEEGIKWPAMRLSISTSDSVYGISIHPDGRKVAAAMRARVAMVFSMTTGEELFHLSGHGETVRAIEYSPRGKRIATGCDDRRLRIYDAENGSLIFRSSELHNSWVQSIAWSPDAQRIVTGSDDGKVRVVDVETGQLIYDTAFHNNRVHTVLYTTKFFISGSDDRTVKICGATTGVLSGKTWTTGQTGYIRAIAISPDGKILAAGSDDCSIILYNMDSRTKINHSIRGHSRGIRSLAFSKDGQILASCADDKTVRLWNVHSGRKICDPLYDHTFYVSSVKFSPDMKQLVTGGEDNTIRFFDMDSLPIPKNSSPGTGIFRAAVPLKDGHTIVASDGASISRWSVDKGHVENVPLEGSFDHLAGIKSVSISPDGRLVATASDRTVIIWQAESGKILWGPLEGHTDDIFALNFSSNSKMVVSGGDDRKVWIWSAATGKSICGPMEGHTAPVRGVCFSPDWNEVASESYDSTAITWSVKSGVKVHDLLLHHGEKVYGHPVPHRKKVPLARHRDKARDKVCGIAYSPDGLYLATSSDDTVAIWNVAMGKRVFHFLRGHGGYVRVVNWSPDSKRIISGALDNVIRVFDVETGTLLCEPLTGHKNNLTALSSRPSLQGGEPEVVSASLDGTVRVWALRTTDFVKTQTYYRYHRDWIPAISFSPVNDHIASGGDDGELIVGGATEINKSFKSAHTHWIHCVTYSQNGKKIATCSDDRTIVIWDADNGERLLEPLEGHTGPVLSIEFSPDGNFLISGSEAKNVRTWDGHSGAINAVAYSSSGELIFSGSASGEIAVWEGKVSDKPISPFGRHEGPILSICVFKEEKIFSSSEDRTIRIWELSTGHPLRTISHGHTAPINAIKLTSDGKRIVSASDDCTLRIYDSHSGEPCTPPLRLSSRMLAVAVSHDGSHVACSGADKRVHVWRTTATYTARRGGDRGAGGVWPDDFIRTARWLEPPREPLDFCAVDEQGLLGNFTLRGDGWLYGSTNEPMCWIPSDYRAGLWTPQTVGVLGASKTILDLRNFVHGDNWEQCRVRDI